MFHNQVVIILRYICYKMNHTIFLLVKHTHTPALFSTTCEPSTSCKRIERDITTPRDVEWIRHGFVFGTCAWTNQWTLKKIHYKSPL